MFLYTFFTGSLVSSVQQQEAGRFWQEEQGDELKQPSETDETKQPGPQLLCTK